MTPTEELDAITTEFREWKRANGYADCGDIDDVLGIETLTAEQSAWVDDLSKRWDLMQSRADVYAILGPLGFERKCTGGNCYAWSKISGTREILICTDGNETEDAMGNEGPWWICGVYDIESGAEIDGIDAGMTLALLLQEMRKARVLPQ